jgi:hypothetical protein
LPSIASPAKFVKISSKPHDSGRGSVVQREEFEGGPPPRTYILALSGTSFKSLESLATKVEELTKKYSAHIHGLLVLDDHDSKKIKPGEEWLIRTRAYENFATERITKNSFYEFIESMKNDFMSMFVGRYPSAY